MDDADARPGLQRPADPEADPAAVLAAMKRLQPGSVPTLRAALAYARDLGLQVTLVHRTGEVRVTRADGYHVTVNNRRTDASRALLVLIRSADKRIGPGDSGRPMPSAQPGPTASLPPAVKRGKRLS